MIWAYECPRVAKYFVADDLVGVHVNYARNSHYYYGGDESRNVRFIGLFAEEWWYTWFSYRAISS